MNDYSFILILIYSACQEINLFFLFFLYIKYFLNTFVNSIYNYYSNYKSQSNLMWLKTEQFLYYGTFALRFSQIHSAKTTPSQHHATDPVYFSILDEITQV